MPDFFSNLSFSQPYFLVFALIPFLLLMLSRLFSNLSLNRYCDKNLQAWVISNNKKTLNEKLYLSIAPPLIGWILLSIALAGPRINIDKRSLDNKIEYNNAIVFVLDLSKSMLAEDVYPDRITKAKLVIEKILANTKNYLSSLVVYANKAHIVVPLTYDKNIILNALQSMRPDMLPVEGSEYITGLQLAATQLPESTATNKMMVLLSDGDFKIKTNVQDSILSTIPINTIGVGTLEGQVIPNKDGSWLTFKNRPVISRLNTVNLKAIARRFNGAYYHAKGEIKQNDIQAIINVNTPSLTETGSKTIIIWQQIYQWFLIPALVLFVISTVQIKRMKSSATENTSDTATLPIKYTLSAITVTLFSFILYPTNSNANSIEQANIQYLKKNYLKAEKLYKTANDFSGLLGHANSAYKQHDYTKALHLYTQAIAKALNDTDRATAMFNLANTYYTIGDYEQAISIYRDTLRYSPKLKKAKINLEYAIIINKQVKRALALRNSKKNNVEKISRTGNGPKSADVESGTDVGNSKVSLSDNKEDSKQALYNSPDNKEIINQMIQRGIKHSIVSSSKIDNISKNSQWDYEYTTLNMVELIVKQEKEDDFNLWKRLFEIEEGFPAPVDTPHIKKGVNPW